MLARALVFAVVLGWSGRAIAAPADAVPRKGLQLWLRGDLGFDIENGKIRQWRDQSGKELAATVPGTDTAPAIHRSGRAAAFSSDTLLQVRGEVCPPNCRELTVVAVARVDCENSVVIYADRAGAVPLVQLDVEGAGLARFIVRDAQSKTISSLTPAPLEHQTIYTGILRTAGDGTHSVQVWAGRRGGTVTRGPLSLPLTSDVHWIGGLRVGQHRYSFDGTISELLVYDRALTQRERGNLHAHLTDKYEIKPPPASAGAGPDSFDVLDPRHGWGTPGAETETDVCVVGCGSGGTGAALAAARRGVKVLVVERQKRLGGTGTNAFVNSWEPGPGCSLAEEIYRRMRRVPGGAGVAVPQRKTSKFPMGFNLVDETAPYSASLRRIGAKRKANVSYKPAVFDRVVREMLAETGNVTVWDETTFFEAETEGRRVTAILVNRPDGTVARIRANVFIDCTGDVYVCRSAGCETALGLDAKSRFGESLAPDEPHLQLNAISRCYTIRPSADPKREPELDPPVRRFPRCAWITGWRDGVRTINPLPMMPGRALIDYGYDECMRRSERIARAHWRWLQPHPEVAGYELDQIAPMLGIREGYRVVTEYVLKQSDLEACLPNQRHPDIIALADHSVDIHGGGGVKLHVKTAYGIPYRCLIPKSWTNLMVACRGAGFSRIAASSVRLERTMIQLGHAAGAGAAMAAKGGTAVADIDVPALVTELDARSRYPTLEQMKAGP